MSYTRCPDCQRQIPRSTRASHQKLYCEARGAPGLKPRKCSNPARDCPVEFVPQKNNPRQAYCGKVCSREADMLRRARAPKKALKEPEGTTEEERDARQMAAIRAREARQRAEADRLGQQLAANAERQHALFLELMGVAA